MQKIDFTKMVASGNDFVVIYLSFTIYRLPSLAKIICDRKYGIGADGLLVLEKSKVADIRMRIFNPDGTEAEMCGNGVCCVALLVNSKLKTLKQSKLRIKTKAGIIDSEVNGANVKIKLINPSNIKLDIPIKINNRVLKINFINTGVPHAVIFVEGLDKIDIFNIGRQIRYHKRFMPKGTNVDFVELLTDKSIKVRTYERGVENETLACGTGAIASALITNYQLSRQECRDPEETQKQSLHSGPITNYGKINVHTKSGEVLKVYFNKVNDKFTDIWLEGKAKIVYKGVYYV